MNKPSLVFLIRGFVDRKNWIPVSIRKHIPSHTNKTIDFLKVSDGYFRLQEQLKKKYKVSTVVSTYDTSRPSQLIKIRNKLNATVFLSPEKGSYQFTTVVNYLEALKRFTADYLMVLRADLWLSPYAIDEIADLSPVSNTIYTMYQQPNERTPYMGRTPDFFHFVPRSCVPFYLAFSKHVKSYANGKVNPHMHYLSAGLKKLEFCFLPNGVIDLDSVIQDYHFQSSKKGVRIPPQLNLNFQLWKYSVLPPYTEEELELYAEWRKKEHESNPF